MMYLRIVLLVLGLAIGLEWNGMAQQLQGANWLFGKGAGIRFKNGTVKSDTGSRIVATHNCGSISDAHGNLLFYTNGSTVWNRHHQVMPNGTGLLANDTNKTVLIQQKPGSASLYYIFVANQPYLYPKQDTTGQLYYTLVDMDQQGGLGDVLPMMKNVLVLPRAANMLAAALHQNGSDVWLLAHGFGKTTNIPGSPGNIDSTFYAFLITSSGVASTPVRSYDGKVLRRVTTDMSYGAMRMAPSQGLFSVQVSNNDAYINLYSFNRLNGLATYKAYTRANEEGTSCFSSDSKYLFSVTGHGGVEVVNVTLPSPELVYGSSKIIVNTSYHLPWWLNLAEMTDIQLGIDGKLYVNPYRGATFLSRINYPCNATDSISAGWEYHAVDLQGRACGTSFPVLNQTLFVNAGKLQAQATRDTVCVGDSVEITAYGAGAESFQWTRNLETTVFSTQANLKVAPGQTTTYHVKGSGTCAQKDTSVTVVVVPRPLAQINGSQPRCGGKLVQLSNTAQPGWQYRWATNLGLLENTNANPARVLSEDQDTVYTGYATLVVANAGCSAQDSVLLTVFPTAKFKPTLSPSPDTAVCQGQTVLLSASPQPGFQTIWSTGDSSAGIVVGISGVYSVRYKSLAGCLSDSSSSVRVTVHPLPVAQALSGQSKDTTLCFPARLGLGISPQPHLRYQWQGQTDSLSNSNISNPVFHFAHQDTTVLTVNCQLLTVDSLTTCQNHDSLTLHLVPFLRPAAGANAAYCTGLTKPLGSKGFTGFTYQWLPTEGLLNPAQAITPIQLNNASFETIRTQNYVRSVSLLGCSAADIVQVQVFPGVPRPQLSGPQFVCPGVQSVPYQFSTAPSLSNFEFSTLNFEPTGGDSVARFVVNWNTENPFASIKLRLGNVYGCQPDSVVLPISITRNLKPQTTLKEGINDSLCLASAQNVPYFILPFNAQSRYQWSLNPKATLLDSTHNPSLITYNQPGLYTLTLTESDTTPIAQCFGESRFPVRIWPQPEPRSILGKDSLCVNGNVQLTVDNLQLNSQYSWSANLGAIENLLANGEKVLYRADFESPADFTQVQITSLETSDKGCLGPMNEKTLVVESQPKPELVSSPERLEWSTLQNRRYQATGRPGSTFQWSAENGTVLNGQGTTTVEVDWHADKAPYRLRALEITQVGCMAETEFAVIPYDSALFIPNLVTPNGDGKNDRFEIKNLRYQPDNRLEMYDRWGKLVYQSEPYGQDWPTEKIPAGTYFYRFQAAGKVHMGWVGVME